MNTPLASKTTVSSRNKMAAAQLNNHIHHATTATVAKTKTTTTTNNNNNNPSTNSRIPPRTAFKAPLTKTERTTANLAATSSRIALARSRLSGNSATSTKPATTPALATTTASRLAPGLGPRSHQNQIGGAKGTTSNHRLPSSSLFADRRAAGSSTSPSKQPSFTNSRSSSKLSSISSSVNNNNNNVSHNNNIDQLSSRQSSLTSNAQATVRKHTNLAGASTIPTSNYIPDTNTIRKGLAKFSNPIECQRQFQTLNSRLRELTDINENKEKTITRLQDQLNGALNQGVGYAIVVQYFSNKLKLDNELNLEEECEQLKTEINQLRINERDFEHKLETVVNDYKVHLKVEQDLKAVIESELKETRVNHSNELVRLKELHDEKINDLEVRHSDIREELENRIQTLETDLNSRTKELNELRKEYDALSVSFNKLEESLTRDKDARVKYAQEKANQLQKDVDSLNSVLEMRSERIRALEKDSILLGEVQHELMKSEDNNKALKQQLESLTAALENKRIQYENLSAEHEKIAQELKRERKERRRMTMRTEQLEYVLNESCTTENNITVLDASVES
uniref:Microtubule-associated tumor suppressor candidate 2 n=1 Tax=Aceria tosichella TaxID=561515 RepID=A0A6G1SHC1_9ACAR